MLTRPNVHLAVIHYPVYNKNREVIATCLSSYDLHDIARVARCYRIGRLYFVNPMQQQHDLAERIIGHWLTGYGAFYNPTRQEALQVISLKKELGEVTDEIEQLYGHKPIQIVTTSKKKQSGLAYETLRAMINRNEHTYLIIFGTGWGLADDVIEQADYLLEPIMGDSDFNHLSVRSASAIVLDRLLGDRTNGGQEHA
ncbi:RNA methyltransferase [bacterium]|nr:RNA methyltransferase [bacterium]